MLIGAIADDLTGATDLALMLARGGMKVLQTVGVPSADFDFGDAQAVVVSLKSRTIPTGDAVAQALASARVLQAAGARQLFFKYCSTFDSTDAGNIGPVIDALLELTGETRTIACPAFPANKRTVYRGHLFVGDDLLSDSSMKDHPLTPMRDANLVRVLQRQSKTQVSLIAHEIVGKGVETLRAAFDALEGVAIVDAIDDADLRVIGAALKDFGLVTGGSGIALGLPANFDGVTTLEGSLQTLSPPAGRSAAIAGSCSAATRRQVTFAEQAGVPTLPVSALAIASGETTPQKAVEFVLAQGEAETPIIYSSAEPEAVALAQETLGRERAGDLVEQFMAEVSAALARNGVTRLLVAGGETSGAAVSALGIKALEIGPEIDPGVPWTRAEGNAGPMALALKSGNFGTDDFFVKAWDLIQ